ncbi:hypothetical protein DIPPA_22123 [Diplonema papillatum]|nr:hypothetical protein DIPPA_22123 [Diplonema papillatum]
MGHPLTDGECEALAEEFKPHFFLAKGEQFLPSSVEEYLENSELLDRGKVIESPATVDGLVACCTDADKTSGVPSRNQGVYLRCKPEFHFGVPPARLDSVPVYVRYRFAEVRGDAVLAVTYIMFFPYNGAYNVLGWLMGGHEADWEHVTVHLHQAAGSGGWGLHSMWFHAHRERDGALCRRWETRGGRPVVYVARNGHGTYKRAGVVYRIFGVANDQCSAGRLWQAPLVFLPGCLRLDGVPAALRWVLFPGDWGTSFDKGGHCSPVEAKRRKQVTSPGGCPPGPALQSWWVHEPCRSRHWFRRVFLPSSR